MKKIKLPIIIIFILLSFGARGQNENRNKISVKLLKEDFNTLRSKLESTQPGLYLYTPKDSLDKIFEAMLNAINEPMTSLEFYRTIAPINKILRNLHTLFWASAAYENGTETGLPHFPLDVHWREGKMYVLRNHSNQNKIIPGSVVNTINGERVEAIFEKILASTIRDGFNETYPTARASKLFGFFYAELIATPKTFIVELTTSAGEAQQFEIPGMTATEIVNSRVKNFNRKYSQYSEDWEEWRDLPNEPALRMEMKGDVGIMTLRTLDPWIMKGKGQNYETFIDQAFDQLAKNNTKDLIIDLRNNHGGYDLVGMLLMSHLHDSAFNYFKSRTALVKPIGKSVKKGNMYEIIGRNGWVGNVMPAQTVFKGNVYVLMNGYSASATGEFIGHLKNINRAVFIGEESGGNPVIFTGSQRIHIDLPNTHITGFLPLHLIETNVRLKNNGHGVVPDYVVKPDINDILQEKDKEMELAFKLIRQRNGN